MARDIIVYAGLCFKPKTNSNANTIHFIHLYTCTQIVKRLKIAYWQTREQRQHHSIVHTVAVWTENGKIKCLILLEKVFTVLFPPSSSLFLVFGCALCALCMYGECHIEYWCAKRDSSVYVCVVNDLGTQVSANLLLVALIMRHISFAHMSFKIKIYNKNNERSLTYCFKCRETLPQNRIVERKVMVIFLLPFGFHHALISKGIEHRNKMKKKTNAHQL